MFKIENLKKSFNSLVFTSSSFTIESNGIHLVKGQSGAGKSTFLNMLAGKDKDYEGRILFKKKDVKKYVPTNLGYCTQDIHLLKNKTIGFHFDTICGKNELLIEKKISLLEDLNIIDCEEQFFEELSNGERRKVFLALLVLSDCDAYLLDEPFADLDKESIVQITKIIEELAKEKIVIIATHIVPEGLNVRSIINIQDNKMIFKELNLSSDGESQIKKKRRRVRDVFSVKRIILRMISYACLFSAIVLLPINRVDYFTREVKSNDITNSMVSLSHTINEEENNKLIEISRKYKITSAYDSGTMAILSDLNLQHFVALNDIKTDVIVGKGTNLVGNEVIVTDVFAYLLSVNEVCSSNNNEILHCKINFAKEYVIEGIIKTPALKYYKQYIENPSVSNWECACNLGPFYCYALSKNDGGKTYKSSIMNFIFNDESEIKPFYKELKRTFNLKDEVLILDEYISHYNNTHFMAIFDTFLTLKYFLIAIFAAFGLGIISKELIDFYQNKKNSVIVFKTLGFSKKELSSSIRYNIFILEIFSSILTIAIGVGELILLDKYFIVLFVPYGYILLSLFIPIFVYALEIILLNKILRF